jgi:hypothetical protein
MTHLNNDHVTHLCSPAQASFEGWATDTGSRTKPTAAFIAFAIAAGVALAPHPTSAQVKFAPDQCAAALRIAEEVTDQYDISPRLEASFERFRRSRCDVETRFERDTEIDVKAFLEFRMKFEMWRTCNDNPIRRGCTPRN